MTPFWLACKHGNVALIKVLLQRQVDINSQNKVGIIWMYRKSHNLQVFSWVVCHGNINCQILEYVFLRHVLLHRNIPWTSIMEKNVGHWQDWDFKTIHLQWLFEHTITNANYQQSFQAVYCTSIHYVAWISSVCNPSEENSYKKLLADAWSCNLTIGYNKMGSSAVDTFS